MVFSFGHLVIFDEKPENCAIPDSFRENPSNLGRVRTLATIFFQMKA